MNTSNKTQYGASERAQKQPRLSVRNKNLETVPPLGGPLDIWRACADFRAEMREMFVVFYLDAAHRVILREIISIGTLTESLVHPREVFRPAIANSAAAIVAAHNHPSGSSKPSHEDEAVTRRLAAAGRLLGVPLLDHVVVSATGHNSVSLGAAF